MANQDDQSDMSPMAKKILHAQLPSSVAKKARAGTLRADELERLLYEAGADMADVQMVIDEYKRLHGD